jgi:hypothetical protein
MEVVLVKLLTNNLIYAVWHLVRIAHECMLTQNRGPSKRLYIIPIASSWQRQLLDPMSFASASRRARHRCSGEHEGGRDDDLLLSYHLLCFLCLLLSPLPVPGSDTMKR